MVGIAFVTAFWDITLVVDEPVLCTTDGIVGLLDRSLYEPLVATVAKLEEETKLLSFVRSLVLVGIVGLFNKSL